MKQSPLKLNPVAYCKNIDKKINRFIINQKEQLAAPYLLQMFSKLKKQIKSKPVYKTSLSDWRSVYHNYNDSKKSTQTDLKWYSIPKQIKIGDISQITKKAPSTFRAISSQFKRTNRFRATHNETHNIFRLANGDTHSNNLSPMNKNPQENKFRSTHRLNRQTQQHFLYSDSVGLTQKKVSNHFLFGEQINCFKRNKKNKKTVPNFQRTY